MLRGAPPTHAAVSLSGDGKTAVFLSHIQLVHQSPSPEAVLTDMNENENESESEKKKDDGGDAEEKKKAKAKADAEALQKLQEDSKRLTGAAKSLRKELKAASEAVQVAKLQLDVAKAAPWEDNAQGPSGEGWIVHTDPESGAQYELHNESGETKWIEVNEADIAAEQSRLDAAVEVETAAKAKAKAADDAADQAKQAVKKKKQQMKDGNEQEDENEKETDPSKRSKIVIRCVCNAVATDAERKYLWTVPVHSEPIIVPEWLERAEQTYRANKKAQTGSDADDETDDLYSPLRRFELECLKWLQTPRISTDGSYVLLRMHDVVRVISGKDGVCTKEETHENIVEIDPDVYASVSDSGLRATARNDGGIIIWDVRSW
mgnify:CR=1 FL=1